MNGTLRTFLLVALVVAILLGLHFLPAISIGDRPLRRVNILSDLLPPDSSRQPAVLAQIPDLPPVPVRTSTPDSLPVRTDTTDSLPAAPARPQATAPEGVTMILDYGQGQPGGMAHFYSQLARIDAMDRPLRIAYFGDSFIEGDILTSDLREQLQEQYGGCGVGWVDCASQVAGFRQSVGHSFSGLDEHEVVRRPFSRQRQGLAQRYFTAADTVATITLRGSRHRRHLDSWQRATLYLRTDTDLLLTTIVGGDTLSQTIAASTGLQTIGNRYAARRIVYRLSALTPGASLYGVALEGKSGIVVDNFSMRGSSGTTLAGIPASTLQEFADVRPYDLLVFHFGLNVADEKFHTEGYDFYIKSMGQAIEHLRQAWPQASILVVSMPDRDQRTDQGLRTMLGVETLVSWQQLMAARHHVAFFNLFQAMGGPESMALLVDRGLANKDYTHLNFSGGRRLATLLTQSLNAGFDNYQHTAP